MFRYSSDTLPKVFRLPTLFRYSTDALTTLFTLSALFRASSDTRAVLLLTLCPVVLLLLEMLGDPRNIL
jgi:hypothetical protein